MRDKLFTLLFVAGTLVVFGWAPLHFGWTVAERVTLEFRLPTTPDIVTLTPPTNLPLGAVETDDWNYPGKVFLSCRPQTGAFTAEIRCTLWKVSDDHLVWSGKALAFQIPQESTLGETRLSKDKSTIMAEVWRWKWGVKFRGRVCQFG